MSIKNSISSILSSTKNTISSFRNSIQSFSFKKLYRDLKTNSIENYYNNNKDDKLISVLKRKGKRFYLSFEFQNKNAITVVQLNNTNPNYIKKTSDSENEFNNILLNSSYSILHHVIYDHRSKLFEKMFLELKYILDKDVLDNNSNSLSITPLQLSCMLNNNDFAEALIEIGADYNLKALGGMNLIHLTCLTGSVCCLDYLVKKLKFDLESITEEKFTPLHLACRFGKMDVVSFLLENKVDLYSREIGGLTPLEIACLYDHNELVKILLNNYYDLDKIYSIYNHKKDRIVPLVHLAATSKKGTKVLNDLITKNQHFINLRCNEVLKSTPMHFAVLESNFEAVKCLIRHGANLSFKDYLGNTPLHYATDVGNLKITKLLVEYGADLNARNNEDMTPYHIAMNIEDKDMKLYIIGKAKNSNFSSVNSFDFKKNKTLF